MDILGERPLDLGMLNLGLLSAYKRNILFCLSLSEIFLDES
jgi:hypothetical protein